MISLDDATHLDIFSCKIDEMLQIVVVGIGYFINMKNDKLKLKIYFILYNYVHLKGIRMRMK